MGGASYLMSKCAHGFVPGLSADVVVRLAFMSLKAWLALVPLPTPKRRPLGARNGEHPAEEGLGLLQVRRRQGRGTYPGVGVLWDEGS
jgi:hypothetical protein